MPCFMHVSTKQERTLTRGWHDCHGGKPVRKEQKFEILRENEMCGRRSPASHIVGRMFTLVWRHRLIDAFQKADDDLVEPLRLLDLREMAAVVEHNNLGAR